MTKKRIVGCLIALGLAAVLVGAGFVTATNLPQKASPTSTPTNTPRPTATPTATPTPQASSLLIGCSSEAIPTTLPPEYQPEGRFTVGILAQIGPDTDMVWVVNPDMSVRVFKDCVAGTMQIGGDVDWFIGNVYVQCSGRALVPQPYSENDILGELTVAYRKDTHVVDIVVYDNGQLFDKWFDGCVLVHY